MKYLRATIKRCLKRVADSVLFATSQHNFRCSFIDKSMQLLKSANATKKYERKHLKIKHSYRISSRNIYKVAAPKATSPLFAEQVQLSQPSLLFSLLPLHRASGKGCNYTHVADHKFHHSKDRIILSYRNNNDHCHLRKSIYKKKKLF